MRLPGNHLYESASPSLSHNLSRANTHLSALLPYRYGRGRQHDGGCGIEDEVRFS